MMGEDEGLPIGEKLKRARGRQGVEIREVEERTKIRIKYLRALENEDWDVLPNPAYAKGFLRTYAETVGLDADALVDEYRRTVEHTQAGGQSYVLGEPVLETRRRMGGDSPWAPRVAVIGGVVVLILAVLLVLGLTGGDEHKARHHPDAKHAHHHDKNAGQGSNGQKQQPSGPVDLTMQPIDAVEVCLAPGHGPPKIDSQVVPAGQRQGPYTADHFRLDLYSGGTVELGLNGHQKRIKAKRKSSYDITAARVTQTDYKGPNCP
jgi:cytoskeleton protein RodZ